MKVLIVLSAFFACAMAGDLGGQSVAAPVVSKVVNVNTGHSTQFRKQDAWGNYAFGYDNAWQDGAWGSGQHAREERGDAWGNKEGSYSLNIGDGRSRVVKYVADGHGFRASIKTNEPGIVSSNPAAADINTPHGHVDSLALGGAGLGTATAVGGYTDGLAYGASNVALGGAGLIGGAGLGGVGLAGNGLGLGGAGLAGGYGLGGVGLGGAGLGLGGAGLGLGGAGLGGVGLAGGLAGGYKK